MEEGPAGTEQACPRCRQTDFNYEDLDEGTKLVCRDCGYVLDVEVLVHQRTFDEEGALQAGVRVGAADDGRSAGQHLLLSFTVQPWVSVKPSASGNSRPAHTYHPKAVARVAAAGQACAHFNQHCERKQLITERCRNCSAACWQQLEGRPWLRRQQTTCPVTEQRTA